MLQATQVFEQSPTLPKQTLRAQSSHQQTENYISVEYNPKQRNYAIVKQNRALQSVLKNAQI